jgi:TDG/mug DNA glycosylase family protein
MANNGLIGLAALSPPQARVLLLGSMPGAASLAQQQYYAHPRNLFWPIMAVRALNAGGIALWDVIASCQRAGSLDSAIRDEQVNDFAGFFASQPNLAAIGFNGGKAWQSFKRHVLPLQIVPAGIKLITLPSTSPAHAALDFNAKLQQWQQLRPFLLNVN